MLPSTGYKFQLKHQPESSSLHMVLKGEKLIALWWLTNGANWFREEEMEKWWQKCTASHLRGKCGRAGKTAQLTLMEKDAKRWIQDRRNSGRDRHTFPQARVSWLIDRLLRTKGKRCLGKLWQLREKEETKGPGKRSSGKFHRSIIWQQKQRLQILWGKRPKLFQLCLSFWI